MDKMSRALAAKGGLTVTIVGKECMVRPLGMRELKEVELYCLERYKRAYLQSCRDNLDLLPEKDREGIMTVKWDESSRWDMDSLPPKYAYDGNRVKVTKGLRNWLSVNLGMGRRSDDNQVKQLATTALDQGSLPAEEYERLTGGIAPPKLKVSYSNWWITSVLDGMITLIWMCFRQDGVTREQVMDALGDDPSKLAEVSREIERISLPSAGNG